MFQRRGNHILKGATFKGKNMLPIGSIFFPLRVDPMRIENNFKENEIEKPPKLNYTNIMNYVSLLKSPNFDARNILKVF